MDSSGLSWQSKILPNLLFPMNCAFDGDDLLLRPRPGRSSLIRTQNPGRGHGGAVGGPPSSEVAPHLQRWRRSRKVIKPGSLECGPRPIVCRFETGSGASRPSAQVEAAGPSPYSRAVQPSAFCTRRRTIAHVSLSGSGSRRRVSLGTFSRPLPKASITLVKAGCAGFLILTQCSARPAR